MGLKVVFVLLLLIVAIVFRWGRNKGSIAFLSFLFRSIPGRVFIVEY